MKFKNLSESDLSTLREKHAKACETWAKNPTLHPTVDTYTEAYFKGARHALSLPVRSFGEVATLLAELTVEGKDREWNDRAWKALMHGDAETVEDALALTEKVDPPSDPIEEGKPPPAASQEAAGSDKEDVE